MLTIGVIGLGNISVRHRMNVKTIFPDCQLVTMSASGRVINEIVGYSDLSVNNIHDLIDAKPYFVIVASPATSHANHAIPLIESGIPVLIEKPVTATVDDLVLLNNTAQNFDTPIAIAYCLRYLSSSIIIKKYINDDLIGPIYNVDINIGQYLPGWRISKDYRESVSANKNLGGGALLELSHEFDYIQWLLGDLSIEYSNLRNSHELCLDVEEIADIIAVSEKGTICSFHLDFLQKKTQRKCSFIGAKGRLDWDLIKNTITLHDQCGQKTLYSEPEWDKNNMYISMLTDFISCIEKKEHNCINLRQASRTIQLVDEIKSKARWGQMQ
jgi:predicted dehydrogenase